MVELVRSADVAGLRECMVDGAQDEVVLEDLEFSKIAMGTAPASDMGPKVDVDGAVATVRQASGAKVVELRKIGEEWRAVGRFWRTKPK